MTKLQNKSQSDNSPRSLQPTQKRIHIIFYHSKKRTNKNGTAPIYCRLTLHGHSTEISTGIFISAEDFKGGKIIPRTDLLKHYQSQLLMIETRLVEIETNLLITGGAVAVHNIKNIFINKTYNRKHYFIDVADEWIANREKLIDIDFSFNQHRATVKALDRFIAFLKRKYNRNDFNCSEIKEFVINDFRIYVLSELKFRPSMFRQYFFVIKSVLNHAVCYDHTEKNYLANYKVKSISPGEIKYLSLEQIKILTDANFGSQALCFVRDCFLFQCYTGMAYADLSKFSIADIMQQSSGQKFLIIHRQKTDNKSTIPLLPEAEALINKYKDLNHRVDVNIRNKGVLPVYSNQAMNRLLKQLGLICNIPGDLLCTHTARKTFATTIINSGLVSIESVSKMLGHSKIGTTQKHYAHIDTKKIMNEMEGFSFTNLIKSN